MEPRLILLMEPLSNLDAKLREEMRVEIRKLIKKVGISALYVTHDQEEAFTISDAVIVMEAGKILQYAAPDDIYNHPALSFCRLFLGGRDANGCEDSHNTREATVSDTI